MLDFSSARFRDQVMGCWMGKNCGGTLGEPLEKPWGETEPFNIDWYPVLLPGGMPNDDLEMQLVWLKCLEERGITMTARDLAQYWQDHIGYNMGEYGLTKTNLKLGLLPPASGAYNNWFRNMMGCPIRSEIWACIAPGVPRLAVRYAYEDAITDHAGGESIWGEFFNTAMESAAFVESDYNRLLDIGRSYVPDGTKTAKAIDTARAAHKKGLTWLEARKAVLKATPSPVAQYSPINMGFQVIGLLYGRGFGHTLCLTVNCGWDTDCTAATLGSIMGIIRGYKGLPEKWLKPLGKGITTTASWGGIKNVENGPNPIPKDIEDLTDRTIALTKKVMAGVTVDKKDLMADASVFELAKEPPMSAFFPAPELDVRVLYGKDPVIAPGERKKIVTVIDNPHPEACELSCSWSLPDGWTVTPAVRSVKIRAGKTARLAWTVSARTAAIRNSNRLFMQADAAGASSPPAVPVVLVGARALRVSGPYKASAEKLLETICAPEKKTGKKRGGKWKTVYTRGNRLPVEALPGPGIVYLRTWLDAPAATTAFVKVDAPCPYRVWVDGKVTDERKTPGIIRPLQPGGGGRRLAQGRHEILIKLAISGKKRPEVHLIYTKGNKLGDGLTEAEWTQLYG